MFKKFLLSAFCVLLFSRANASHLMGGEITWECQGGGQYIFTMKLYRDCNGAAVTPSVSLDVLNYIPATTITLNLVSQNDISPVCNPAGPSITCAAATGMPGWPSSATPLPGAVQESIYQSGLITLTGVPPAAGWIFTYTGCCRNNSIVNLQSPGGHGYTLRAVMYAFNGQNSSPCFDSSPKFLESPSTIMCLGTPFNYNHNAFDPDLDSLSYSWAQPLDQFNVPIPFTSGYTFNSPLPGIVHNASNVPATIDPSTGEISFTSYTQGSFVTVAKVEAWKCGQLVAEIYREIQIVLLPCGTNTIPSVTFTSFQDTVEAGTLINFTLNATDPDFQSDGITPQTVTISATGNQFGSGFTNPSSGCSNPPCATLSPAPPSTGSGSASTIFNWQTDCGHISANSECTRSSNTYTFVFKTRDDFCPAPSENISTVSITVLSLPLVASPEPRCVAVMPNGNVSLTWIPPVDTDGTFDSYHIYSATNIAGPYTILDSVFVLSQDTYIHAGANAQVTPRFYYIQSRSGCFGKIFSPPVDTIRSVLLNVTDPGNGTASLSWNPLTVPTLNSSGMYDIYEEYPAGIWSLTGTTTQLSFIDSIYICNAAINFRIQIQDSSGCVSISSVDGGFFENELVPIVPVIDTLSVDDNNDATMSWNVSPDKDVEAYIVYKFISGIWLPIDTVYGINNNSYVNLLSAAGNISEEYRFAAFDSCGNVSPLGNPLKTIYLTAVADVCAKSANLSWTAYPTIGTGLAGYRIYFSSVSASGPYVFSGSVAAGILEYTHTNLTPNTNYFFKVEAYDQSGSKTASSNRFSLFASAPVAPGYSYLRSASVSDPDKIIVTCHVDTVASKSSYTFMRSVDTISSGFVHAGTVQGNGTTPVVFTDANVLPDQNSYFYKMIHIDSCGNEGIQTNIGRTILLKAMGGDDFLNTLSWNDYEDWLGGVMSYNVYRGIDGVFDPVPITNILFDGSDAYAYVDDISFLMQGQGVFNYYIEAIEGMGNPYGFGESSMSNVAEAYQEPKVFIPNAFRPGGSNGLFLPVGSFVDITEYEFSIFNRWGLRVFNTTEFSEGWDGTRGGTKNEPGVYVYLLRYKSARGEYIEQKGSVTLIR